MLISPVSVSGSSCYSPPCHHCRAPSAFSHFIVLMQREMCIFTMSCPTGNFPFAFKDNFTNTLCCSSYLEIGGDLKRKKNSHIHWNTTTGSFYATLRLSVFSVLLLAINWPDKCHNLLAQHQNTPAEPWRQFQFKAQRQHKFFLVLSHQLSWIVKCAVKTKMLQTHRHHEVQK